MSNDYDEFNSWKTLIYADECKGILSGKFRPPVVVHIYPTNTCNSNCHFCIMREERKNKASIDPRILEGLLQEINNLGTKAVHISGGGEPTLYENLHLIKHFKGYKVLSTNGIELTPETTSLFDRVRVSINAGTAVTHAKITFPSNFDRIVANFKVSKEKNPGVQMGLGFVVSDKNWEDIFNVCRLADELHADFVHIRPAYFSDPEQDKKIREIIRPAYHLCEAAKQFSKAKLFAISEKFDGYWSPRKYDACLASPLHAVVAATGELIVCQDVFIRFGNLHKQTFSEIWGSDEHKAAIAKIDISKCPRCVMSAPNAIIKNVFQENKILMELL